MQAFNTLYVNSQAKPIINNLTFIITFLTFCQKKQKGLFLSGINEWCVIHI